MDRFTNFLPSSVVRGVSVPRTCLNVGGLGGARSPALQYGRRFWTISNASNKKKALN